MTSFMSKSYGSHHVTGLPTLVSLLMDRVPIDSEAIQDRVSHDLADVSHVGRFCELGIVRLIQEVNL